MAQGTLTDVLLRERLAAPLSVALPEHEHPAADAVVACAAGELEADEALAVTRHLALCADGRCPALFGASVAGQSAARDALYGTRRSERSDTALHALHLRSPRSFRCDDALWSLFVQMAHEQGRPIDALLNEALAAYSPASQPPQPQPPAADAAEPRLTVIHEGVFYEVTKPRFVVGRRAPASDLTIDDPAVSRQHALVERAAGHYYLVDMGSTNGVEYRGERILRKEIRNGDRFRICDHELLFVLQLFFSAPPKTRLAGCPPWVWSPSRLPRAYPPLRPRRGPAPSSAAAPSGRASNRPPASSPAPSISSSPRRSLATSSSSPQRARARLRPRSPPRRPRPVRRPPATPRRCALRRSPPSALRCPRRPPAPPRPRRLRRLPRPLTRRRARRRRRPSRCRRRRSAAGRLLPRRCRSRPPASGWRCSTPAGATRSRRRASSSAAASSSRG